jgi:hypothetical protein
MPLMKRSMPLVLLSLVYLWTAQSQQVPPTSSMNAQGDNLHTVLIEYNRSIKILTTGLQQNWSPDRYELAFGLGPAGGLQRHIAACSGQVQLLLRPRSNWDERMPFNVEVHRAIDQCRQERDLLLGVKPTLMLPAAK